MAISGIGSSHVRGMHNARSAQSSSFEKLSTGKRLNKAADDAAGLAIATQLLSELGATDSASRNIDYGVSQNEITDGALQSQGDIVARMRELAVQSSNGTLNDSNREAIQTEFNMLREEVDRIAGVTEFNGNKVLEGGETEIQVGTSGDADSRITLATPDSNSAALGLDAVDLSTADGAFAALDALDSATEHIANDRSTLGAVRNRLDNAYQNNQVSMENIAAAASRIADTDIAEESTRLALSRVREGIGQRLSQHQSISAGMLVNLVL